MSAVRVIGADDFATTGGGLLVTGAGMASANGHYTWTALDVPPGAPVGVPTGAFLMTDSQFSQFMLFSISGIWRLRNANILDLVGKDLYTLNATLPSGAMTAVNGTAPAPTLSIPPGTQDELLVVTAKAKLFTVSAYNSTAGTLYLQAHDVAAEPLEGIVPRLVTPVFAGTSGGFNFTNGTLFRNGIYLCWSSTPVSKTKNVTAEGSGLVDATFTRQS